MASIRIQKLLSDSGIASRRAVEQMILEGKITVNDNLVTELPCFVDPDKDEIVVNGQAVPKYAARKLYILVNKPRGIVCSETDSLGRPTVFDLVPPTRQRLFCLAQLDPESSGLVVLTNDGELTKTMTNPRAGVLKKYVVEVDGRIEEQALDTLKDGMYLDGRRTRGAFVKVLSRSPERSMIEIDVVENVNRQVRRVLARLGHKVRRMKRLGLGMLSDRGLKIGHWRELNPYEIKSLKQDSVLGASKFANVQPAAEPRPMRTRSRGAARGEAKSATSRPATARPGTTRSRVARPVTERPGSRTGTRPPSRTRTESQAGRRRRRRPS